MYEKYFKRIMDVTIAIVALIVLSPLLFLLTILGMIFMKGNPFFIQERPGKDQRIFKMIKFRTMTNEKDEKGRLLSDAKRMRAYGTFLRKTSLDELLELINILKGDMSLVGPRPLLVCYLERYTPEQNRRHEVRPGLTGLAQVNGRNAISWENRFELDVQYVDNISFYGDIKIILSTVMKAFIKQEGITSETSVTMEEFMGSEQKVNERTSDNRCERTR